MAVSVRPSISSDIDRVLGAYPPLIRHLLFHRGITTTEAADHFLNPDWERDTFDPLLLPNINVALDRIEAAMRGGETIAIWADYDCDGLPGAVILLDMFRKVGHEKVETYVPHRVREGFGMNVDGVAELHERGVTLIITVDCGIADVESVEHAKSLGIDVIVTDHHLPHEMVPPAHAIVNPKLPESTYPDDRLCGAAIAFKLAHALYMRRGVPAGQEKWLLDMAGLATVADMVPLLGENRAIARFGITVMQKSRRPGIQALLRKLRLNQKYIAEEDLSFSIVPRINAASRMGSPQDALRLLSTIDEREAGLLAAHLDSINNERKGVVAAMVKDAKKRLSARESIPPVIVIGNVDWKPSLAGLVAQSLANEYRRPAFVWGREESATIKGSARSFGGVSLPLLMEGARDVLLEAGGHAFSGGFSALPERAHLLEDALNRTARSIDTHDQEEVIVDCMMPLSEITHELFKTQRMLAPFGEGNPKPRFLIEGVFVKSDRVFGKGSEHLELMLGGDGATIPAVAFFKGKESFTKPIQAGKKSDILAELEYSTFGTPGVRLRLIDVV